MSGEVRVKICGLSEPAHARHAVECGADLIGLVFYPKSHRYVTPDEARQVADIARQAPSERGRPVTVVGLFVNEPVAYINDVANRAGLDVIQLSGTETPEIAAKLNRPVIGTVRLDSTRADEARERFAAWIAVEPWAVHLDSHVPGMYGGSGVVGDWELAREFAGQYRVLLAGGLGPGNVAAAISEVGPYAVDVSSGVETGRRKDPAKIRAFIEAARAVPAGTGRRG